jgi:hypothetical protein
MQDPNGSFLNNVYTTADSVLAATTLLNGTGLLGLRRGHCNIRRHRYTSRQHHTIINPSSGLGVTSVTTPKVGSESTLSRGDSLRPNSKTSSETVMTKESATTQDLLSTLSQSVDNSVSSESRHDNNSTTSKTSASTKSSVTLRSSRPEMVRVRYWLWIGPNPSSAQRYNLTVQVPVNSTFFFVMQRAAELASDFE